MTNRSWIRSFATASGGVLVHVTGLVAVACGLLFFSLTPASSANLYAAMSEQPSLHSDLWRGVAVHAGISAMVWVLLFTAVSFARQRRRDIRVRRLRLQAGTVMIETVIVLPVFLLLVFGMMQMTVNNIASVMTSYAGFAGARAVWVWDGERVAGRRGVDEAAMLERARVQIAMAMAPVATGDFLNDEGSVSDELKGARKAMHGRFSFIGGDASILLAATDLDSNRQAYRSNKSFWRAIDSERFGHRAVRKLTRAYLATDVGEGVSGSSGEDPGILETGGEIGLRFTYQHHQTMPVVSALFGELGTSGGRGGYFNELSKEHTLPRQRHTPSANWPEN